ncbi:MAG: hypothetical protein BGO55_27850 [Sphingobacteriales bacterium 50-39]|nr:Gfo/Idh/MocA family oxidoreductase [Sphingobacteriales bacterium]OJW56857.1 MAG: hypothetical protein BGO55_27850 [Sphingobacteriales bacterium 50-39]
MKGYRIGIIGAGSIVESNHLPAIASLPGVKFAWIYDKNAVRSALVSKMYGVPALAEDAFDHAVGDVDICLLAIPYGTRKPYIDLCRRSGKAIVIEKPFAFSKEEHLATCEGFDDWAIAVNFQRRYYRSVAILRHIVRSRPLGGLRSIRFIQGNFTLKGGSGYLSSAKLAGGGVIAESSSHILDIILSVAAAKSVRLQELRSLHMDGLDYDSIFDSLVETAEGEVPVHCEISTLRNLANGLYLEFDNGLLTCDLSPDGKIFLRNKTGSGIDLSLTEVASYESIQCQATRINEAFLIFWQQFILGLGRKEANLTSACTSILTSSWLEGIYEKISI